MMRSVLLIVCLAVAGAAAPARADVDFETVALGLEYPWSIAFLPGGGMLVTERAGRLRIIQDGKLRAEPVAGVPESFVAGQGGLFDVVLDPAFESNRTVYLTLASGTAGANATRLVRAQLGDTGLTDVEVLFTASPSKDTPHHYGGRMAFLPDGTLLLTVGEGFNYRERAQTLDNHFGKVIRVDTRGNVPPDNPFAGNPGVLPEIWSYGHRNVQAIVVLPGTGEVYISEHGPRGGDELNRVEAGLNYGWPAVSGGIDYSGAQITPYTDLPDMQLPLLYWTPSIAPSGMTFYDGAMFPAWRGDLLVSALAERSVRRIDLDAGRIAGQETLFTGLGERIRDVRTGPDGAVYLLTDSAEGKVLRVTPGGD